MRDSDRQSGFPAARSPFQGRRGNKPRSLQANWWARACAAVVLCAAAAIALPAQTFNPLLGFNGADGAGPYAGLVQGPDGNLYGTTSGGGAQGYGTIFKITSRGELTTLYSFCSQSNCADGARPNAGLVQGRDGNFYGTTYRGGANGSNYGTVFKITPSGTLATLYNFCLRSECTDGTNPESGLVQGTDGSLYGTTAYGGNGSDSGTVFKIALNGTLKTLHSFCSESGCTDGAGPFAGLIEAIDGNFYGTTARGGDLSACPSDGGCGTVFKITPEGALTTIESFDYAVGANPTAALVQATDGNFYGTTYNGGSQGYGAVFKIAPAGTLTTLYSFGCQGGCVNGANPGAGLVQGTDGNFYSTTQYGGADGYGTVFKITPAGTLTTLHSFDGRKGELPYAALVQDTNGTFYGTTPYGGPSDDGTIFHLSVGLGPFVETQPTSGRLGTHVKILGTNLTGSTSVTFNGTPATFTVVSPSLIRTTVPAGATTGTVQVVTPGGTLKSNVPFRVVQ